MIFTVKLSREAVKVLDCLDRCLESRIREGLHNLENEPSNQGKMLKGMEGLRSLRVGDWRILFTLDDDIQVVYVLAIRPRGQAYRNL